MFNKKNPSDEFLEKIKIYKKIHKEGQLLINGSKKLPENEKRTCRTPNRKSWKEAKRLDALDWQEQIG